MRNQPLLETLEKIIKEVQAKLQIEQQNHCNDSAQKVMQDWLTFLRQRREELLRQNEPL